MLKHPELKENQKEVTLSENDYNEFVNYMKNKDYSYKTQSDFALEDLKQDATNENITKVLNLNMSHC